MIHFIKKAALCCCVIAIIAGFSTARAEDQDYTSNPQVSQPTTTYSPNDQQYKMPPSYQGKYYPNDETGLIGYHGTSTTAQNQNQKALDGNGYYYYYY